MAQLDIYSQDKKKLKAETLSPIWDKAVYRTTVYEVALWQQSGRRSGTASTKTRAEVRGSGKKIYKQKGTGNARHADGQASIFVGGGVASGPKPKDWSYQMPKEERRQGIRSVLTQKLRDGQIFVVDKLDFSTGKTKAVAEFFKVWGLKKALIVTEQGDVNLIRAVRNLHYARVCGFQSLNVADVITYQNVVLTQGALKALETLWATKF